MTRTIRLAAILATLLPLLAGNGAYATEQVVHAGHERQLIAALTAIRSQRLDEARSLLANLVRENPGFRLAQVIYADLLQARSAPLSRFGNFGSAPADQLADLDAEARVRLAHYLAPPDPGLIPRAVIGVSDNTSHVLLVELGRNRLFVLANRPDGPQLVADYYISAGRNGATKQVEGDRRTPIGVYQVTSQLSASRLPDFYGSGAYPINYPNEMDRRLGKTGSGIWLHGSPKGTYARPPLASDGCVVLSNPDFTELGQYVHIQNTPVVIVERSEWLEPGAWRAQRSEFMQRIEDWRRDWESLDNDRYLENYSRNFAADGMDHRRWTEYKQRVNTAKSFIQVRISDISMYHYAGLDDVVVVNFAQEYTSSNHESRSRKRQYWQREHDGRWRIIYEGSA